MTVETAGLQAPMGVEVFGVTGINDLLDETVVDLCLQGLDHDGVVVIRGAHLDDEGQLEFSRRIGTVFAPMGKPVFEVNPDSGPNAKSHYLRSNLNWHIDGQTPNIPVRFGLLTARRVPAVGGATEFADTYAAYASLPWEVRNRLEGLRVVHTFEATQRGVVAEVSEDQLAYWRSLPAHESWLVWQRRDGRRSLVLTASVDHVAGMDAQDSRALLDELLAWSTQERFRYVHHWQVGDLVMWDNTGILHRATLYDTSSDRVLHRTAIAGDETWS